MNDGTAPKPHIIFMLLDATPEWLSLSREQRDQFVENHMTPILARYPALRTRFFDAEAYTTECSDVLMIETSDLTQHRHFIDALRDTDFYRVPYFEIVSIIPTVENGHVEYDEHLSTLNEVHS